MNDIDYVARSTRYDAMPYRRLGSSGLKLPTLSLGLWQNFGKNSDSATARDLLLRAFDLGITHFDLANNYGPPPGAAEEFLGQILSTELARKHRTRRAVFGRDRRQASPASGPSRPVTRTNRK